jgi:hypothetical protein
MDRPNVISQNQRLIYISKDIYKNLLFNNHNLNTLKILEKKFED